MNDTTEFDAPLFKKLTKTDTGSGGSNQAGFLVPKELEQYFPPLPSATAADPAPNMQIDAAVYIDTTLVDFVKTSYQYQTRGPSERRSGALQAA